MTHVYRETFAKMFFWRTKQQQEIDYVEEKEGHITGYEFTWKKGAKKRTSGTFKKTYGAEIKIIDRNNFREFVLLPFAGTGEI